MPTIRAELHSRRDLRAGLRPRARPPLADGVRAARRLGPARRGPRRRPGVDRPVSSHGRVSARRGAHRVSALTRDAGNPRGVRRGRQCVSGRGLRAADRVPDSPGHARAVDAGRHARLGKDDGVGPRRQRARRDPSRPLRRCASGRSAPPSFCRARAPSRRSCPARTGRRREPRRRTLPCPLGVLDWARVDRAFAPLAALGIGAGGNLGSNSWVLAGSRTASGKPILANDPHLGLRHAVRLVSRLPRRSRPAGDRRDASRRPRRADRAQRPDRLGGDLARARRAGSLRGRRRPRRCLALSTPGRVETFRGASRTDPRPWERERGAEGAGLRPRADRDRRARRRRSARSGRGAALDRAGPGSRIDGGFPRHRQGSQLARIPGRRRGDPGLFSQLRLRRHRGPHWLCRRRRDADPAEGRRPPARFRVRRGRLERDPPRREPAAGPRSRARIHRHGQQSGDLAGSVSLRPDLDRAVPGGADRGANRGGRAR